MIENKSNIGGIIGIVILNYKNCNDTINCINSIFEHCKNIFFYLVIVDNFSQDNSITEITKYFIQNKLKLSVLNEQEINDSIMSDHYLITSNKNLGYAKGNNVGIKFLINKNVDSILILNNDILFKNNILNELSETLTIHPEIGLLSPLLLKLNGNIDYNCCRIRPSLVVLFFESLEFLNLKFINRFIDKKYILKYNSELINRNLIPCDIISGSCIMAKRETWELLNGFDPNTFLYYEENILFEKIKKLKLKTAILSSATAIHLGAKSTKEIKNTFLLGIELKSLTYYLKIYRKANPVFISSIILLRKIQILLVGLNNRLKKRR